MANCIRCGGLLEKQDSGFFRCNDCGAEVAPENIKEK